MTPEASSVVATHVPSAERPAPVLWLFALLPLVLLGALLALIVFAGPSQLVRGDAVPVERLAFTRVQLTPGTIELSVLNDGPDEVSIAQVAVDDAFWAFQATSTRLGHLDRARVTIPYPWVNGEAHVVRLITSTGVTFDHTIDVAIETPKPDVRSLGAFALIGLYVGVIPVAIGLLWFPLMTRIGRRSMEFLLALTIGLLAFLLVDSTHDGLEAAALVPGSLQGASLFVFGAVAAFVLLEVVGNWLAGQRRGTGGRDAAARPAGWTLAVLVAIGIGLHNFGEGLAIGSAFALGELALGTMLIVGFTLHNTTEGLAIVAPLAREGQQTSTPVRVSQLVQLGIIGGVPTILGAWIGGFVYSPILAVLFLAIGVGGIAQVTRQILAQTAGARGLTAYVREAHIACGLAAGVLVMYVTGLFVG